MTIREEVEELEDIDLEESEKYANKAISQMRKGFISALILGVLKEQELHGYGIIKEIEEKSRGIWKPTPSSIYPVLKDLKSKGLVKLKEIEEAEGKIRKVYGITKKGERMLNHLIRGLQALITNLRTIAMGAFGVDGNYPLEDHISVMPDHEIFGWKGKDKKEQEENLIFWQKIIEEKIVDLNKMKVFVNKELDKVLNSR